MTSGLDNLSLALFTALAPAGVVAFIIMALARLFAIDHERAVRIDRMIALPFAVALVGFIASATHLGTPANALHVFSGVGTSPLSNEVLACRDVLVPGWILLDGRLQGELSRCCCEAMAARRLPCRNRPLACTSQAYAVRTVPTWNTPYSPANLLLTGLFEGTVLSQLFLAAAKVPLSRWSFLLVGLGAASLAAGVVSMLAQNAYLASIANNEISAASLAPGYPLVIGIFALVGAGALLLDSWALRPRATECARLILRIAAAILAFAAVFATRIVFYNLHMTVGF